MLELYLVQTHINLFYVLANSKEEAIKLVEPKIFSGFQIFCRKLENLNVEIVQPDFLPPTNLKDYIETYKVQGRLDPIIVASNCVRLDEQFKKLF